MKKFYALLLMLTAMGQAWAQAWDGTTASMWTSGEGTQSAPYLIEQPAHLAYLSKRVGEGETFEGKYFKVANNLDMGGLEFPVIGKYDKSVDSQTNETKDASLYFKGVFDGNHKEIDHLLITKAPETTGSIAGQSVSLGGVALFACTADGSVVRNVTIGKNSQIKVDGEIVAAIIGVMEGGVLENSANYASISATTFGGGLVGFMTGTSTMQYCTNKGVVNTAGMICGGIVSQIEKGATIKGCYNTAAVTGGSYYVGGIVGITYDQVQVKNCYNVGAVKGPESFLSKPHAIIGDNDGKKAICANNYYVKQLTGVDDEAGTTQTRGQFKQEEAVNGLNNELDVKAFVLDTENVNKGFPILSWEKTSTTAIHQLSADHDVQINGHDIACNKTSTVYDLKGRVVATGKRMHIATPGIYVLSCPGAPAQKVVIR